MMIEKIDTPDDLKILSIEQLNDLCKEIRNALITRTSVCGGHFGSNLGVVEMTVALHYVFEAPVDKIIFDVSHQSYVHKVLTGRRQAFLDCNQYGTVTGFTNPKESKYDHFNIGHTSTSISLACGLAKGRDLKGNKENIIAIIGDASLDGGEAFEAINYAGELDTGLIVVVNDNNMSIPENHGVLNQRLNLLREDNGKIGNNYFKSLGFEYRFVRNGHNIKELIDMFKSVKDIEHPVVVHCCTEKGKGYSFAEQNREKWHHAHPFNIQTGKFYNDNTVLKENYGSIVGEYLIKKLKNDPSIVAMTASVPMCFGFNAERRKVAGKQFVDVGIAEQHMITMAAALAKSGCKPVTVTESSFYQRTYDQIQQEMCINKCAVTMLVAFSGIYAHNDNTHIGLYDIVLLGNIPGLIYLAPSNKQEYLAMLEWSIEQNKVPVAIRIPWNGVHYTKESVPKDYSKIKYAIKEYGSEIAILGLGSFYQLGEEVYKLIKNELEINSTLIDPMFVTGVDDTTLNSLKCKHRIVVTLEDGIVSGGFGAKISQFYSTSDMKIINCGFGMEIPTTFTKDEIIEKYELNPSQIVTKIEELLNELNRERFI